MAHRISFLPEAKDRDSGNLLPWVIAVMVYLSALALLGAMSLHGSVSQWTASLSHSVTVQISAVDKSDREQEADAVLQQLKDTPGIASAERLGPSQINALLEPWLGEGNVTDDLPVPILIDVTLDQNIHIDTKALAARIKQVAPSAETDDHQQWLGQLLQLTNIIEMTAAGIVLLILLATIAIVMFGTKAGMASHRNTIETMHIIGAKDGLIAQAFQRRFLGYGFKGGIIGLIVAAVTIGALVHVASKLGDDVMLSLTLSAAQIVALATLPFLSALIAMLTARITVRQALAKMV